MSANDGGRAIKPLDWQKHNVDGTLWDAPSVSGGYVVRFDGRDWIVVKNIVVLAREQTCDAAKTAAQADNDSRILSWLTEAGRRSLASAEATKGETL